ARETPLPSVRGRARLRGVAALGLVTACAVTSSVDGPDAGHEQPGEPRPGSTLPGPGPATPGPPRADAAAIDAAGDGGLAPAPEPGAPCPVVDAIIARPCG